MTTLAVVGLGACEPDPSTSASPPVEGVDRPVLVLSGIGDTTEGNVGVDRRATFELLAQVAPAFLAWVDDPHARHTTFDLSTDSCQRAGGPADRCSEIVGALGQVGLAFLDAATSPSGLDAEALTRSVEGRLPTSIEWHRP